MSAAAYVVTIAGRADGTRTDLDGDYLVTYDPDAHDGGGDVLTSPNIEDATRFASAREAWLVWQMQSGVRPLRPDGQPNRPLTAFNIIIQAVPE